MSEGTLEANPISEAQPRRRLGLRGAFLGLAMLLLAGGVVLRVTAPKPEPVAGVATLGIAVDTLRIGPVPLQNRIEVAGIVEARRQIELFAEQEGRVLELGAEELDRVAEGDLLVRLDPLAVEVDVARAEASLAQARSELDLARTSLKRRQNLASNRVSSESDLDQASNAERVALATLRASEATLRDAKDRLSKKTLVAPFAGVLRDFDAEEGEYVHAGQRIGELLEVTEVRITIGVRDREVVAVSPGAVAEVRVEARPGEVFEGRVARVAGASDPQTRKFPVQIELDNPGERLLPGMIARVSLDLGEQREASMVPRDAVLDDFGLSFVYVVEEGPDGAVARQRRVTVRSVPFQPGDFEVVAGISPGERIATTALRQLRDGARVELRREELP